MAAFVTAPAGFLLAVLWFDLMFDVQALGKDPVPERELDSIAGYYGRVLTGARPMNVMVAVMMLATLTAIVVQLAGDHAESWVSWCSLVLAGMAIGLAGAHTVGAAGRLGTRSDPIDVQSALARSVLRDHLVCITLIASMIVLQLAFAT